MYNLARCYSDIAETKNQANNQRTVDMSLLVPSSETILTDVSDVCDIYHENNDDKLKNNCSNDIEQLLIETEKNLKKIMKIKNPTFDKLMNQLELSLLKQLKHALEKLKIDNNNNNNSNDNNMQNQDLVCRRSHNCGVRARPELVSMLQSQARA